MIWEVNVPWDYDLVDYQRMHMMCCESDDDVLLLLVKHHQYCKMMTERYIAVAAAVTDMRNGMLEVLSHEMMTMMAGVVSGRCCYKGIE